jgi:hypothetical protein
MIEHYCRDCGGTGSTEPEINEKCVCCKGLGYHGHEGCFAEDLHKRAERDVIRVLGNYITNHNTWYAMCYWLEGWYMREGQRVQVDWEPSRTHRALLRIVDKETGEELHNFEV